MTQRMDLILEYREHHAMSEVGDTFHHGVATWSIDLIKRFEPDVSFIWDRVQNPEPSSSGDVPQQDDFRLVLGLGARS